MATCKECLHYKVCAREGRLVQFDEHTWDNYNQLDAVEVFCREYMSADVVPRSEVALDVIRKLKNKVKKYKHNVVNPYEHIILYLNELEKKYTEGEK